MIIPEFILQESVQELLDFLYYDCQKPIKESFLYKLLGQDPPKLGKFNYLEQARTIFNHGDTSSRKILVDLMFNLRHDQLPSIHINTPSDNPGSNSLGLDEDGSYETIEGQISSKLYRQDSATFDIVIVSDNSNEVVLIYRILRSLLVSYYKVLSSRGLINIKFSGQDLTPYADLSQKTLYMRTIRLSFEYTTESIELLSSSEVGGIVFNGKLVVNL